MTAPLDTFKKYREIAERATPGPWFVNKKYQHEVLSDDSDEKWHMTAQADLHSTAHFIATFNPKTVLRLLDTIERYKAPLEFYAERKNWAAESYKSECLDKIKNDITDNGFACPSGGARAREALRADAEETKP